MINYNKKERRGLPGGPNEQFSYVTGFFTQSNPFRSMIQYQDGAEVIPPYDYIDRDFGKRFGNDSSVLGYSNNAGVFLGERLPEAEIIGSNPTSLLSKMRSDYAKLHPLPEGVKWGANTLEGDPELSQKWLSDRNAYIYERMRAIPQEDLSTEINKASVENYMDEAFKREIEMLSTPEGLYRIALSLKDAKAPYRNQDKLPISGKKQDIVTFDNAEEEAYYIDQAKKRLRRLENINLKTKPSNSSKMRGRLGYYSPSTNSIVLRDARTATDVFAHEMNHAIGNVANKWQDRYLMDHIEFKDLNDFDTDYMLSNSDEITAFLRGTRASMQKNGYIQHPYEYITAEQLKEAYNKRIGTPDNEELKSQIKTLKKAIKVAESDKKNITSQNVRDAIDKRIQDLNGQIKQYERLINDIKNNEIELPYRFLKSIKPTEENFKNLEKVINSLADNNQSNTYDDFAKFGKELKPKRKLKKKAQRGQEVYDYEKNLDFETMQQYVQEVGMPYAWRQFNDAEKAMYRKVMSQFNYPDQPVDVYDPRGVNAEYYQGSDGQTYMQNLPAASIKDIPLAAGKYIKEFDDRYPKPKGSNLVEDWENKRNEYVVQGILKDNPELTERDVEYINSLTPTEQKFLSTDRRFQQSYWRDMVDGLSAIGALEMGKADSQRAAIMRGDKPTTFSEFRINEIQNDPTKTDYEKQQLTSMYEQAPGAAAFGEVLSATEAPIGIAYNLGKATYDPNYTMDQALEGEKSDITTGEELAMDAGYEAAMFFGTAGLGNLAKGVGKGITKRLLNSKLKKKFKDDYTETLTELIEKNPKLKEILLDDHWLYKRDIEFFVKDIKDSPEILDLYEDSDFETISALRKKQMLIDNYFQPINNILNDADKVDAVIKFKNTFKEINPDIDFDDWMFKNYSAYSGLLRINARNEKQVKNLFKISKKNKQKFDEFLYNRSFQLGYKSGDLLPDIEAIDEEFKFFIKNYDKLKKHYLITDTSYTNNNLNYVLKAGVNFDKLGIKYNDDLFTGSYARNMAVDFKYLENLPENYKNLKAIENLFYNSSTLRNIKNLENFANPNQILDLLKTNPDYFIDNEKFLNPDVSLLLNAVYKDSEDITKTVNFVKELDKNNPALFQTLNDPRNKEFFNKFNNNQILSILKNDKETIKKIASDLGITNSNDLEKVTSLDLVDINGLNRKFPNNPILWGGNVEYKKQLLEEAQNTAKDRALKQIEDTNLDFNYEAVQKEIDALNDEDYITESFKDTRGGFYRRSEAEGTDPFVTEYTDDGYISADSWLKWAKEHNPVFNEGFNDIAAIKANIPEYRAIEMREKANGTWMKNADGSDFSGSPEMFVQQRSSAFQKAYPEDKLLTQKRVKDLIKEKEDPEVVEELESYIPGVTPDVRTLTWNNRNKVGINTGSTEPLLGVHSNNVPSNLFTFFDETKEGMVGAFFGPGQYTSAITFRPVTPIPDYLKDIPEELWPQKYRYGVPNNEEIIDTRNHTYSYGPKRVAFYQDIENPILSRGRSPVISGNPNILHPDEISEQMYSIDDTRFRNLKGYEEFINSLPKGLTDAEIKEAVSKRYRQETTESLTPIVNYPVETGRSSGAYLPGEIITPYDRPLKSALGNSGLFDRSNMWRNEHGAFYRGLAAPIIGAAGIQLYMQQQEEQAPSERIGLYKQGGERRLKRYQKGQEVIPPPQEIPSLSPISEAYRKAYGERKIAEYLPDDDLYVAQDYPESVSTGQAPNWLLAARAYEEVFPEPQKGEMELEFTHALKMSAWAVGRNKAIVETIEKERGLSGNKTKRDVEIINSLPIAEQRHLSRAPKYQTSTWKDVFEGVKTIGAIGTGNLNTAALIRQQEILNDPYLTDLEKKERLQSYQSNPETSLAMDVFTGVTSLGMEPAKLVQAAYKKDYSLGDALSGRKNYATMVEDAISEIPLAGMPTALEALGMAGRALKPLAKGVGKPLAKGVGKRGIIKALEDVDGDRAKELVKKRDISTLTDEYIKAGDDFANYAKIKRKELTTPEGQRRLKNMFKEYLKTRHSDWTDVEIEDLSDMLTSKAVLEFDHYKNENRGLATFLEMGEMLGKNISPLEKRAIEYYNNAARKYDNPEISSINDEFPESIKNLVDKKSKIFDDFMDNYEKNRALGDPPVYTTDEYKKLNKEYIELHENLANYNREPGGFLIGPGMNKKPIYAHEVQHSFQVDGPLPVDISLKNLKTKKEFELDIDDYVNLDYFLKGSGGREKSAFLAELREQALQDGFIKDRYENITPEQVKEWYEYYKKNPTGVNLKSKIYNQKTTHHRIFDIMEPVDENFELLSKELNKLVYNDNSQNDPTIQYVKRGGERRLKRGGMSKDGYKRYSPDVNNDYNIIPSGNITMKDVDFPVMGIDNFGNKQMMYPGYDYVYPGNTVLEIPMLKKR